MVSAVMGDFVTPVPLHVALDLDKTLVFSHGDRRRPCDFELWGLQGTDQVVRVQKRPGVDAFLLWLAQHSVEVSVFSAATSAYAARIVGLLDPDGAIISNVRSREACSFCPQSSVMKDVSVVGTVKRTVLVDNDIGVFRLQPENGILVDDYDGDGEDTELSRIVSVLEELLFVEDVRDVLGPKFSLRTQLAQMTVCAPVPVMCTDVVLAVAKLFRQRNKHTEIQFIRSISDASLMFGAPMY
jgi:Dullard-like phosphatase family protein